jgi:Transposase DNA-binding
MDHEVWANEEFGKAMLRDGRRLRRLLSMGAKLAERPSATVTGAFRSEPEIQAAYDFLEHDDNEQEWSDVAVASHHACAGRCLGYPYVLAIEDGSSWSFTDSANEKGLGPIGTRTQGARGIKVMTSYAVSPEGVPLGVLGQVTWIRSDQANPVDHAKRALLDKESRWWTWLQTYCDQLMAPYPDAPKLWHQMDAEADQVSVLLQAMTAPERWLTVRACHNRCLASSDGDASKLMADLALAKPWGLARVRVQRRVGRPARQATCDISVRCVSLRLRAQYTHRLVADVPVTVVVVREQAACVPTGQDPLEWILYTTYPVETFEDAVRVARAYSFRWRIESFHYTTKTGAGHLEQSQLRSLDALRMWITLHSAVAARHQHILHRARTEPDVLALEEFSEVEVEAARLLHGQRSGRLVVPATQLKLGELVLIIAKLGGYLGSATKAPPGIQVFERGMADVLPASEALTALRNVRPRDASRATSPRPAGGPEGGCETAGAHPARDKTNA